MAASVQAALPAVSDAGTHPIPTLVNDAGEWLAEMSRGWRRMPDRPIAGTPPPASTTRTKRRTRPADGARADPGESAFRSTPISSAGRARLMQVMPFWIPSAAGDDNPLPHANQPALRLTILRHYLDIENGNLFRALGRYNGSLGKPDYPTWSAPPGRHWTWTTGSLPPRALPSRKAAPRRRADPAGASRSRGHHRPSTPAPHGSPMRGRRCHAGTCPLPTRSARHRGSAIGLSSIAGSLARGAQRLHVARQLAPPR